MESRPWVGWGGEREEVGYSSKGPVITSGGRVDIGWTGQVLALWDEQLMS